MSIKIGPVYQWDLDRTIIVTDDADEMHWQHTQNVLNCPALRTPIENGVAHIPNLILQTPGKLKCWSFNSHTGQTVAAYAFDVIPRNKPNNYVYTETEATTVEQYVNDYLAKGQVQFSWNKITDKPSLYSKEEVDAISEHKADLREGKIPREQLPNVVKECPSFSEFPETGETGVIYIDTATNNTYRWDGEKYVATGGVIKPVTVIDENATDDDVPSAKAVRSALSGYAKTTDVDSALDNKADKSTTYTKTEVTNLLASKANTADVNNSLANKQDKLVSGTNIKTINGQNILGTGNINIVPPETITALEQAKAIVSQYQPNIYSEPQEDNEYDIVLFAGQSNMCGRAALSDFVNPEDVMLSVPSTMAITFNNTGSTPVQIVEPISANGSSGYGLVPAFINAYYYTSKRKICTCYQSVGGTMLNKFLPYTINFETNYENWATPTTHYANMRNYINNYKTKLESIGKTVGRIFMVWLQGESDADYLGTDSTYCTNYEKTLTTDEQKIEYYCAKFKDMVNKLSEDTGLEHCFIIRIGHRSGATNVKYNSIIQAQNLLGRTYDKCTLVSAFFAGTKVFVEEDGTVRNLMRDSWHYVPEGYVRAGYEAGVNAAHCVSSNYAYKPILVEYNQVFLDTIAPADSLGIERKVDKYLYHPRIFDMRTAQRIASESVTSITVAPTSMTLEVGQTVQLEVTVYPASATNKDVTYQSSNTSILTVSETGLVTAVAEGSATITVRSVENTNATATFSGTVLNEVVAVTEVQISQTTADMLFDDTLQLTATVLPENATNKGIVWTSSDDTMATVDSTGLVTALKEGIVTIRASSEADSTKYAECVISISYGNIILGVTISQETAELEVDDTLQLTASVYPESAENKNIVWSSSNESIATVSNTGLVTALAQGEVTIRAASEAEPSVYSECVINIVANVIPVSQVQISQATASIMAGNTLQLTATVLPVDATNKNVVWSSSNTSVATVTSTGLVTALAQGSATIKVESVADNTKYAECALTVTAIQDNVLLDLDFTQKTVEDYVNEGIIEIPSGSNTSLLSYDSDGIVMNTSALPYGLKLKTPIQTVDVFTLEFDMKAVMPSPQGTADNTYANIGLFSGLDATQLEHSHASVCISPCVVQTFASTFALQIRPQVAVGTSKSQSNVFVYDGEMHSYKLEFYEPMKFRIYRDGVQIASSTTTLEFTGYIGYVLGIHQGYPSASQFKSKTGQTVKRLKLYIPAN